MKKLKIKKSFLINTLVGFFAVSGMVLFQKYTEDQEAPTFSGVVQAEIVQLSAPHSGKISRKTFEEGEAVVGKQELFKLDDEVLDAQKEYAKALVSQLEKEESLKKLIIEEVMHEYIEARRQQRPQGQIDKHVSVLQKAQADYDVVRSNLIATQKQQNLFEAQIHQQTVSSPFSGVVHKEYYQEGDLVQGGQKVLSIYDPKKLKIKVQLDPKTFSQISLNHPAKLTFKETFGEKEFSGKVEKLEKKTDIALVSLDLTIDSESINQMRPGMVGQVCFSEE